MIKKTLFISALCLALAGSLRAYTITENFAADPFSNGWTNGAGTGTTFMYNNTNLASVPGYLDSVVQRSNSVTSQAYIPLDKTYYMPNGQGGSATVNDMWIGFDLQFGSSATTQQFMIGLFNSAQTYSSTASQNSLGLDLAMTASGLRIRSETINSSGAYLGTSTGTTLASLVGGTAYRFQTHYYIADGKVYADVKVGTFNEATGALTTNVFTQSGILLYDSAVSWDTVGMNALGVKNLCMTTSSGKYGKFALDNLYFSTDGEQSMVVPSWVTPEPATMVLLGLGSLLVGRRRKA